MKNNIKIILIIIILYNCQITIQQNQNGTTPSNCSSGEVWQSDTGLCVRDCLNDTYSTETFNQSDPTKCECIANFTWDDTLKHCVTNCNDVPNSNGQALATDVTKCQCNIDWLLDSSNDCTIRNCSRINYTTGNPSSTNASQCDCIANFTWISNSDICARDCRNVFNSFLLPNLLAGKQDQCICSDGYVWTKDNLCIVDCTVSVDNVQCQPCPQGCQLCSFQGCSSCQPGFAWNWDGISPNNTNGTCHKCLRGCTGGCDFNDISICFNCSGNSYTDPTTNKCAPCPIGCASCSDADTCFACTLGFRHTATLTGQACFPTCLNPCQTCSDTNSSSCLTCISGFQLNGNSCTPNTTCNNPCTNCQTGSYITGNNCHACSPACLICSGNANNCTSCADGYQAGKKGCQPCPIECKTCGSNIYRSGPPVICHICADGYYADAAELTSQTGLICKICSFNCHTCVQSSQKCMSCNSTDRVLNFRCYKHYNAVFNLKLDYDPTQYSVNDVIAELADIISQYLGKNASDVIIYSITPTKSGQLVINGSIAAGNTPQSAINFADQLTNQLKNNGNFFPNFNLVTGSAAPYYDDTPIKTSGGGGGGGLTPGQIAGIIVGSGIFLLALVILIPCCIYCCGPKNGDASSVQSQKKHKYKDRYYDQDQYHAAASANDYSQPAILRQHGRDF